MVSRTVVISEPTGLHLRPAGLICELSQRYQSKVVLKKGSHTANAKSVLGVLAARVQQGDEIEIICDGADEEEALDAIMKIIQDGFRVEL